MAYLNMIFVESTDCAPTPSDGTVFRWTAHHVKEIFLHFLPKRFELDGSTKFTLYCGPSPCGEPIYNNVLGASWYHADDFDFAAYYGGNASQREETVLAIPVDVLARVASEHHHSADPIWEAAEAVRRCGFALELPVVRLSRSSPDRTLKLRVFRRLSHQDGEAWGIHVLRRDGTQLETEWITDRPDYLDRTTHLNLSRWTDGVFEIVKRTPERICYSLSIDKYKDG